jgi:hypothetical protein
MIPPDLRKMGTKAAGQNPLTNIPSLVTGGIDKIKDIGQEMFADVAGDLGSKMRGKNLPGKGSNNFEAAEKAYFDTALENKDWRVKLSVPPSIAADGLLAPLQEASTGGHMVFPFTPTIIISHSAAYNTVAPIHNNYPFFAYQNSQVDAMTIVGQFYCQNATEARYWMACLHYLRTMTKMDYGIGSTGSPPPIAKLNGYGDYVFNNVPVIIQNFTVDMPNEVDYISTSFTTGPTPPASKAGMDEAGGPVPKRSHGWAPAESQFSITVQPIYSRSKQANFNYTDFTNGSNLGQGYI